MDVKNGAAELALSRVKAQSRELAVPLVNLASAFMVEEALYTIAHSYYADHFILRNGGELSLSTYRRRVVHELKFFYQGSFDVKDLAVVLTRTLIREKESGIHWEMALRMVDEKNARVLMKGDLSGVSVPFELILTAAAEETVFTEEERRLFFYPDRRFTCRAYPRERLLVEALLEILLKMELLTDLSPYDTAYQLLRSGPIDGRHLREGLWDALFEQQLTLDEKRLNMLLNYRDYPYMRKKWKAYLRGVKKDGPAWEDVIDLIGRFLTPLWDALCRDEVFFGDWMPDLERFLQ